MGGVIGTQGVLYHYVILIQTVKSNLMQTVKSNASFLISHIQCLPYAKQRKDALIEENRHRREREIGRMNCFAAAFAPFDVLSRKPVSGPRQPPDDPIDLFRWGQSAWWGGRHSNERNRNLLRWMGQKSASGKSPADNR